MCLNMQCLSNLLGNVFLPYVIILVEITSVERIQAVIANDELQRVRYQTMTNDELKKCWEEVGHFFCGFTLSTFKQLYDALFSYIGSIWEMGWI